MLETLGIVFSLLSLLLLAAAMVGAYIVWRSHRRMDDAAAAMAREAGHEH